MSDAPRFHEEIPLVDTTGSNKVAESTDPFFATAVGISTPGYDGLAEMGRAFVEEFAIMGWPRDRISRMFTVPKFAAAYAVYEARGAEFVEELIEQVLGPADASQQEEEER